MNNIADLFRNSEFSGEILISESMKNHCTFKTGGQAEFFLVPQSVEDIIIIRNICISEGLPLFILGGGANILVSDRGIRGVTLSLEKLNYRERQDNFLICEAGMSVNSLVEFSLEMGLSGLEFLNRLPGSVGGAIYMNARCYGSEIADVLLWADYLDEKNTLQRLVFSADDWDYKQSPFQKNDWIIIGAAFSLRKGDKVLMKKQMDIIADDRVDKGHFKAPCAGSTFKNNRSFGKPSGQIIDECGYKGLEKGGAAIASWHGNIFINNKGATSQEISDLIDLVQRGVQNQTGFLLEPEVMRVGDWS